MPLQYLQKKVRDQVGFLHADKHQSFLQGGTIIIDGHGQAFPKVLEITSLQYFYNTHFYK